VSRSCFFIASLFHCSTYYNSPRFAVCWEYNVAKNDVSCSVVPAADTGRLPVPVGPTVPVRVLPVESTYPTSLFLMVIRFVLRDSSRD
jgi:hypothetical protein